MNHNYSEIVQCPRSITTNIVVADMTGSKCNAVGVLLQYTHTYMNSGTVWNVQVVLGPAELN